MASKSNAQRQRERVSPKLRVSQIIVNLPVVFNGNDKGTATENALAWLASLPEDTPTAQIVANLVLLDEYDALRPAPGPAVFENNENGTAVANAAAGLGSQLDVLLEIAASTLVTPEQIKNEHEIQPHHTKTKDQLREHARHLGLKASGSKQELVARIQDAEQIFA